ncbi:MAG: RNA polymerase sigma-70 factor [Chitinophagaceae bacterium]|nr:RNA polymerase sigma-70 factor [Chitinophagaceae bacterium]
MRISKGDETAFTLIFRQYQGKLYSVALDITHSSEIAEEIIQDVFLKIWIRREELIKVESFSGYLFIVMRNQALDWLVKQARRQKIFNQISSEKAIIQPSAEEFLNQKEFNDLLQKGLDKLPRQQQEVFRLMRQEGLSRQETAQTLNIDANTVKTHMSRALKSLRAWYIAQGELIIIIWLLCPEIFFFRCHP